MTDLWKLYLAYLRQCQTYNEVNDIDPHHYKMEWNHTLPQCLFSDQSSGQWLSFEQHAIASALQTLVFQKNCLTGKHLNYLPTALYDLVIPLFKKQASLIGQSNFEKSIGLFDPKNKDKVTAGKRAGGSQTGRQNALKAIVSPEARLKKIEGSKKAGKITGTNAHQNKTQLFDPKFDHVRHEWSQKGAASLHSQRWRSLIDGFEANASGVARHNKALGHDPKARIRIK